MMRALGVHGVACPCYSLRSASTGSRRAALMAGTTPATSVRITETAMSERAFANVSAMMLAMPRVWSMNWLTGMDMSSTMAMANTPENSPSIAVSALKMLATPSLEAPMARRMPISFLRSSTLMYVMMPIMNGFEVAKKLRADGNKTPILMLTAKDQNKDIVEGLDSGADDYLPKPFSFEVLGARVRALLRRPQDVLDNILTVRDLELDIANHTAKRASKYIKLSNKEFAILEYLLRNKNQILSKQNIMTHVWDFDADILPNNVEVFINYLRNKIDKPFPGADPIIQTVRGFGYIVKDEIRKA